MLTGLGLLCSGFCISLPAQDPKTDSLTHLLTTQPPDTHRVTILLSLAERIATNDYKRVFRYLDEAMRICDSLQWPEGRADSHAEYAELQNNLGAYAQAIAHATEAHRLYAEQHDTLGLARTLVTIGLVQYSIKQPDKAIESFRGAQRAYHVMGDTRGQFAAKHNIAVVYFEAGDTAKAKAAYLQNLHDLQGTPYNHIFAATYNNLGNTFDPKIHGDSAIGYYLKALEYKYMAAVPAKGSIGNTMLNIANVYIERSQFAEGEEWLDKAEESVLSSNEKERLSEYWRMRGKVFLGTGRYRESALAFQELTVLQDSLYGPEMTEQAARLEAAFRSENQQKEIELLSKQQELDRAGQARWRWITGAVSAVLLLSIALTLLVILRSRDRARMLRLLQVKGDEIHRQQQEILLQNEALSLHNKRLADLNHEKDALIGIVAHDIRAPLNRSAALAELIASMGDLNPEQARYIQMIKKVSEDGGRLIQDLLEITAFESTTRPPDLARVQLGEVMDHAVHGFHLAAEEKRISLHWHKTEALALTDEKLLARILDNLISNAIKFTPKGRAVHLSIEAALDRHWIHIRDEGPGISDADQKRMFQKFQRLSARPTGGESSTGLGLSIVRTLADRIGADLRYDSAVGVGTTFRLGLAKG